jgi:hypothetical protein
VPSYAAMVFGIMPECRSDSSRNERFSFTGISTKTLMGPYATLQSFLFLLFRRA